MGNGDQIFLVGFVVGLLLLCRLSTVGFVGIIDENLGITDYFCSFDDYLFVFWIRYMHGTNAILFPTRTFDGLPVRILLIYIGLSRRGLSL